MMCFKRQHEKVTTQPTEREKMIADLVSAEGLDYVTSSSN